MLNLWSIFINSFSFSFFFAFNVFFILIIETSDAKINYTLFILHLLYF